MEAKLPSASGKASAPFALIEAFCTDRPHSGNPAGVALLDSWLPKPVLQGIASTINQAETAFVVKTSQGYELRWFTPKLEVDLCGHATLATAAFLNKLGHGDEFAFSTKSGILTAAVGAERVELDFPAYENAKGVLEVPRAAVLLANSDFRNLKLFESDWVVLLPDEQSVKDYQPDFELIAQACLRGVIITAPGDSCDFVYRFFAPQSGIDEDPATGSAQCGLVPMWAEKFGKVRLISRQLSKRGAEFDSVLTRGRVKIRGRSNLLVEGTISIPG